MAFVGDLSLPSTPPQLKAPNPATRDSRRKTLINARLWKRKNLEEFYKIETNGTATPQLLHWLSPAGSRTPRRQYNFRNRASSDAHSVPCTLLTNPYLFQCTAQFF